MSLLEQVLKAREEAEQKPPCQKCRHLFWINKGTPFCKEKDKFILPKLPPNKCKLQQENKQLQTQLDEWKYEVKCHIDEVIAREKQIEQLQAQAARMWEALRKAKDAINGYSTCPYCWDVNGHAKGCKFYETLQNIDAL